MIKCILFLLVTYLVTCVGKEPFRAQEKSLPFLVYFKSRYRGLCVGTLVSRMAAITAAVCVTNPTSAKQDTRPINIVTGTHYRHPRRGIRVQVTKILIPNLPNITANRGYLMQKATAILLMIRKVPDILVDVPLRGIHIDYKGEEVLSLQEECLTVGWHYFYKGDIIYPVHRFLLQKNLRAQFLNVVKKHIWCETLTIKFQKALDDLGYAGFHDKAACICVRDGMYGAPLICRGKAVGMMMAPDAQWTNCTGFSNLYHLFHSDYLKPFMTCVSSLFSDEYRLDWTAMKTFLYGDILEEYDYLPSLYDKLLDGSDSLSDDD